MSLNNYYIYFKVHSHRIESKEMNKLLKTGERIFGYSEKIIKIAFSGYGDSFLVFHFKIII